MAGKFYKKRTIAVFYKIFYQSWKVFGKKRQLPFFTKKFYPR